MRHGISEQEWVQLVDGTLAPERRGAIEVHFQQCLECRELAASLLAWDGSWREAVDEFRAQCAMSNERARALAESAIATIHQEGLLSRAAEQAWGYTESLDFVIRILGPIYGAALVRKSIQTAALASSSSLTGGIEPGQWQSFVVHFTATLANLCGRAAGGLARLTLQGLPMGEHA
jgi:anti-sigma factor RsiW